MWYRARRRNMSHVAHASRHARSSSPVAFLQHANTQQRNTPTRNSATRLHANTQHATRNTRTSRITRVTSYDDTRNNNNDDATTAMTTTTQQQQHNNTAPPPPIIDPRGNSSSLDPLIDPSSSVRPGQRPTLTLGGLNLIHNVSKVQYSTETQNAYQLRNANMNLIFTSRFTKCQKEKREKEIQR